MGVITISRGSYSMGKEIAEKLAKKLEYDCISREILLQASEQFNVKEAKLIRALHEMKRGNSSEEEARYLLIKDDEERRKWGISLYGIDTQDPKLYDVVLKIDNLKVNDAVEILFDMAKRLCFQTTPESRMILKDRFLAAKAYSAIVDKFPKATVKCKDAAIYVSVESDLSL